MRNNDTNCTIDINLCHPLHQLHATGIRKKAGRLQCLPGDLQRESDHRTNHQTVGSMWWMHLSIGLHIWPAAPTEPHLLARGHTSRAKGSVNLRGTNTERHCADPKSESSGGKRFCWVITQQVPNEISKGLPTRILGGPGFNTQAPEGWQHLLVRQVPAKNAWQDMDQ